MNTQAELTTQRNVAAAPSQSLRSRLVRQTFVAFALAGALIAPAMAAITGTVFQDFNGNGVQDVAPTIANAGNGGTIGLADDKGLAGVTVTARCVTNLGPDGQLGTADDTLTTFASATTNATGAYTITTSGVVAGVGTQKACRVDFTWNAAAQFTDAPTNLVPNPLYGMYPTFNGASSNTATQFANDAATNVNLGLNYPPDFCQNNPTLATTCYLIGAYNGGNSALGGLKTLPYNAKSTGNVQAPAMTTVATNLKIGATWGLAYHKATKKILVSAYLKRHVGVGPGGLGQIYAVTPAGVTTNFLNLETLVPGSTGVDPRPPGAPDSEYDLDATTFPGNVVQIGKLGIGDIDLSDDQSTLYAVGLKSRKLYKIPVGATLTAPSAGAITTISLPDPGVSASAPIGCPLDPATPAGELNLNVRPFALKANRGFVYVGMTCTAESTGNAAQVRGFVYRYDPVAGTFTQVANTTFGTLSGQSIHAWNNLESSGEQPEPFLSDIEFDGQQMVLGIRDRFGDITSQGALMLGGASRTDGRGHGNTLRACYSSSTGLYSPATCPATGFTDYYQDDVPGTDPNGSNGGLLIVPGYPDVVTSVKDPSEIWTSGLGWMSNTNGAWSKGYEINAQVASFSPPFTYLAKANGMGDVEALCDAAPLEVGNRVWKDTNGNGIQDPGEPGIAGVTVNLYGSTGTLLATAVTDTDGQYAFSNKTVNENGVALTQTNGGATVNAIAALTSSTVGFKVCVDNAANYTAGNPLAGLLLTTANAGGNTSNDPLTDLTDSDATLQTSPGGGTFGCITFDTGSAGQNNFGLDAGFTLPLDPHSIGNRIWFDTNNNGVMDAGEQPAPGVSVSLFASDASGNATGAAISTISTDTTGRYRFDGVAPGAYVVVVNATNWAVGGPLRGYASSSTTVDSATNTVDSKDNGIDSLTPATTGIKSGKITVGAGTSGMPTGEDQTAPAAGSIAGSGGDPGDTANNLTIDFGFYKVAVGNQLWVEAGGSPTTYTAGTDTTPAIVQGRTVNLIDTATNTVVGTATTNASGVYVIDSTTAGNPIDVTKTYKIAVPLPAAYAPIGAGTALTDNNNQAPTAVVSPPYGAGSFLESVNFTLVPGATSNGQVVTNATGLTTQPTLDIGLQQAYSIGNRVWFDANNNGIMDAGEAAAPGVSVSVFAATAAGAPTGAPIATVTTDSTGRYRFDGLLAGDYVVVVNASNWATGGVLRGYASSGTTANSATNTVDSRDNGIDSLTPATTGILSGKITVGASTTFPAAEDQTAPNIAGAIGGAGGDAGDAANNLTIDFGFYKVTVGDQLWVEAGGGATTFTSGTDLTPAVVQSKPL